MPTKVPVRDIATLGDAETIRCDVVIIGGGPAGLSVARGLAGATRDILILESGGLEEDLETSSLNAVLAAPETWTPQQAERRISMHGAQAKFWRHEVQAYGLRCRGLGGSTAAWAGKSAAFDDIDFSKRSWVPNSGWPVNLEDLRGYLDVAAASLNLGVNCYDNRLWELMGRSPPQPTPDPDVLPSFFWQIARSKIDPMDVLRAGTQFLQDAPEGCRVLTHATVVEILTEPLGKRATGVRVADAGNRRRTVEAGVVVLAASAIENARLLLVSRAQCPAGLGNHHDTVGRYLMDHPDAVVSQFEPAAFERMARHYGFYGLKSASGADIYMRGLAPSAQVQQAEGLLNCAIYMLGEHCKDDPWSAANRIVKRRSENYLADALTFAKMPATVATGLGRLAFRSKRVPEILKRTLINQTARFFPNLAVEEYFSEGVPRKLVAFSVRAICEQAPHRDNRIYLSDQTDRFGTLLPSARWRVGEMETRTLIRTARIMHAEFGKAGLPQPVLADWVASEEAAGSAITDMGHSAGTTRMSPDPKCGVVDANCKVHGVDGLYVAGASVFATSGHANPTLMIVAFAYRLAAHLKRAGLVT